MKLSIIIPTYNEESTIEEILKRVDSVKIDDIKKEIVVVDDGSSDKTYSILEKIKKSTGDLNIVRHTRNRGKGAAVQTGLKKVTGEIIIIQDADLEYNPNDFPKLLKPIIDKRALVVYGTRLRIKPVFFGKNKTPLLLHFFGNKFLSLVASAIYGVRISDMETGYKVFHKKALNGMKLKAKTFDFDPEITAKVLKKGIKIYEVNIKTKPRGFNEGKKIKTFKDGFKALFTLIKYRFSS